MSDISVNDIIVGLERRAQRAADRVQEMRSEADHLREEADRLEQVGEHLSATIHHLRTNEDVQLDDVPTEPNWASMSVHACLVGLAQQQGGELRTVDAIDHLVKKNVCMSRGHASSSVYTTLARSPRFEKESKGLYRLVSSVAKAVHAPPTTASARQPGSPGGEGTRPSAILLPFAQENPGLTKERALGVLLDAGYDFKGGNPQRIASSALARARRLCADEDGKEAASPAQRDADGIGLLEQNQNPWLFQKPFPLPPSPHTSPSPVTPLSAALE